MPAVILTMQGTRLVPIFLYLILNNQLVNKQAYADISPHHAQSGNKCPNCPHAYTPHCQLRQQQKPHQQGEVGANADPARSIQRL